MAADMAMTWNVVLTWQVMWLVTSALQPIFEWAQFRVDLISAQYLIFANLYTAHLSKQKFHPKSHNKQLQPKL